MDTVAACYPHAKFFEWTRLYRYHHIIIDYLLTFDNRTVFRASAIGMQPTCGINMLLSMRRRTVPCPVVHSPEMALITTERQKTACFLLSINEQRRMKRSMRNMHKCRTDWDTKGGEHKTKIGCTTNTADENRSANPEHKLCYDRPTTHVQRCVHTMLRTTSVPL